MQSHEGPVVEASADDADGGRRFYSARGTERALMQIGLKRVADDT
jgi:hypothetical protein